MKNKILLCLVTALLVMLNFSVKAQQLAFPGAEGYGKYTTGGRGGRVIEVTNLNDRDRYGNTISGSFRAALSTSGTDPITIVFRVSGNIVLIDQLKCARPNITIAGQTAPGDGICIKGAKTYFSGGNIIIRYLRFRVGDELKVSYPCLDIENCSNIIVDHCSFSWSVEENIDNYDTKYSTIQWCIVSEGLYNSYNVKGERAYGGQCGGQYASYHHNIFAHCHSRSPRVNGCRSHDTLALTDFRNNVIFNWGVSGSIYGGELGLNIIKDGKRVSACLTNFINNYYKPGPGTSDSNFAAPSSGTYGYGQWYFKGNFMYNNSTRTEDNWSGVNGLPDSCKSSTEFSETDQFNNNIGYDYSAKRTQTALEAYAVSLDSAGAILPKRDTVDKRIIKEIKGLSTIGGGVTLPGSGFIDSPTEVGGWPTLKTKIAPTDTDKDGMPDDWETANGLNPNDAEDGKTIAADGYSNLEHYLNSIKGDTGLSTAIPGHTKVNNFAVYPNPGSDKIYFEGSEELVKIELYNTLGKTISSIDAVSTNSADISSLSKGVYILKATFKNGETRMEKISKN